MKILSEKENKLLDRTRATIEIEHTGKSTPSRTELNKQVANQLKVNENLIYIKHIYTKFGDNKSKIIINVYKNEKDLNFFEKNRRDRPKESVKEEKKE